MLDKVDFVSGEMLIFPATFKGDQDRYTGIHDGYKEELFELLPTLFSSSSLTAAARLPVGVCRAGMKLFG